jgi:C1A family cysteine protease
MQNKKKPKTLAKINYGWKPDLPDNRDIMYGAVYKIPKKLPPKMDLREFCPPVENQGELGSCTAHALTGALEVLEKKAGLRVSHFSRLFVYYNERVIEHTIKEDSGAMIRDGIKTLVKQGACFESKWTYDIVKFTKKPTPACYKQALDHQVLSYSRIETVDQMRACLADGFPFVFGFSVYDSFESEKVAKTGVVVMPQKKEKLLGGHAVLAVGYDDTKKTFLVRNSWGADWGMDGYFTMPYEYLANRNLSDDFWKITRSE